MSVSVKDRGKGAWSESGLAAVGRSQWWRPAPFLAQKRCEIRWFMSGQRQRLGLYPGRPPRWVGTKPNRWTCPQVKCMVLPSLCK